MSDTGVKLWTIEEIQVANQQDWQEFLAVAKYERRLYGQDIYEYYLFQAARKILDGE